MRFNDAQAGLGFVVSQTAHIERQVNEISYPDIQYPALIPVDTSANPWAKSVTYYSSDKVGAADWISGSAGDVPIASSEKTKFETSVYMAGIGYAYSLEEMNQAAMLGVSLSSDDAMAARRAYEEMVDRVAIEGDSSKNFQGLINNSAVAVNAAVTGDWAGGSTTEDQILADINTALISIHTAANTTAVADTLLLPWASWNLLATTRLGDTNMTILEFVLKNNTYTAMTGRPLTIRALRQLSTAGTSGAKRMIAYRRDPTVLKMHIPMPHRFLTPYVANPFRTEVPGIFRIGGLDIRRPKEVGYFDGI